MPAPSRTPVALKRKRTEQARGKGVKRTRKVKRQYQYHSSSEGESDEELQPMALARPPREDVPAPDTPVADKEIPEVELKDAAEAESVEEASNSEDAEEAIVEDLAEEIAEDDIAEDDDLEDDEDEDDDEDDDSDAASSTAPTRNKKKRNDPDAFATSMQKILGSKLTTSKRADPILSRSKSAHDAGKELADSKLDSKARHKIRDEKHALLEKGRVKDVLGVSTVEVSTGAVQEEERRLKKTAQRGVVKLFNAVRAAQVKGELAARESKVKGVVGMDKRDERVTEMSKKGFLDLIAGGGKKATAA